MNIKHHELGNESDVELLMRSAPDDLNKLRKPWPLHSAAGSGKHCY